MHEPHTILFPHLALSEGACRALSLFLSRTTLLQVLSPPTLPPWARDRISGWPVIVDGTTEQQVKRHLKGYRALADLHGESAGLASVSYESIAKDAGESRFQIESELKGRPVADPELKRGLLLEAAVFMEMAKDLDEKELDLEASFAEFDQLEAEFRTTLGISDEDLLEDAIEALTPVMASEKATQSFMLARRIAFWFRLLCTRPPEGFLVPVTIGEEALEELFDPVHSACDRQGKPWNPVRMLLASLPDPEQLPGEAFLAMAEELRASNTLTPFWESVGKLIEAPTDRSLSEAAQDRGKLLRERVENFFGRERAAAAGRVTLTLVTLEGIILRDLWKCLDSRGYEAWSEASCFESMPAVLLCIGKDG